MTDKRKNQVKEAVRRYRSDPDKAESERVRKRNAYAASPAQTREKARERYRNLPEAEKEKRRAAMRDYYRRKREAAGLTYKPKKETGKK